MVSHARLHAELNGLLRQQSRFADQRHLVLLAQTVASHRKVRRLAGLLFSQTVWFDH